MKNKKTKSVILMVSFLIISGCGQESAQVNESLENQESQKVKIEFYPSDMTEALFTDLDFKNINSNIENENGTEYVIDKNKMNTKEYSENESGFGIGWGLVTQHTPDFCEEFNISMGTTKDFINSKNINGALVKAASIGENIPRKKINDIVFTAIVQHITVFSDETDASLFFYSIQNSMKECTGSSKLIINKSGNVLPYEDLYFLSKNLVFLKDTNLVARASTDERELAISLKIYLLNGTTITNYQVYINNSNKNVNILGFGVLNDLINKQNKIVSSLQGTEYLNYDLSKLSTYEPDINQYKKFLYENSETES